MAHETHVNATWHARPRGSATQTHTRRWRGRLAGPRESTQMPEWRHMAREWLGLRVMGPWVSGPKLEYWGGNTKALRSLTFYTLPFRRFPPCGTMFSWNRKSQVTWHYATRRMRPSWLKCIDCVEPSPPNCHQMHVRKIGPSIMLSGHRTLEILCDFSYRGRHVDAWGASDLHRTGERRQDCEIVGSWPTIIG